MAKRILIVDDDPLICKIIDVCLTKRGHDVRVFYSGVEAVKYLMEETPDSVVLDIRLPDCEGWFLAELLGKLSASERVPIIVTSVLDPDRRKINKFRPYAYLQKPFDMRQLMGIVEGSLGGEASPGGLPTAS